jgi:hypothetical protein
MEYHVGQEASIRLLSRLSPGRTTRAVTTEILQRKRRLTSSSATSKAKRFPSNIIQTSPPLPPS